MMWDNDRTNFERDIAVVIGIDHYDSRGIHDLQTAVSDANAIANLLQDEYGYKEEHIVRLFSPKNDEAKLKALKQPYLPATLEELRLLLTETLPNKLQPTSADRLLFYFAGHGIPRAGKDGPTGYLVPQTAEQGDPDSFLSMHELHDALSKLGFHHLLIILDCCFAGTFRWASSRKLMPILETVHKEHYDRFIRYPAWQVITSAAHDQEALDLSIDQRGSAKKDTEHSPFALALIEGLRDNKADLIQDKVITAHELYLYVDRRVNELSNETQTPGIYPMRLEYDKGEYIFTRPGFKRDDLTLAPPLNEDNNPYRGLKPFEEKHSHLFFGRKALVEKLSHRLANSHCPLTVILGASGSGKSSLVQAGLLPYLRKKHDKEKAAQDWYILNPMRPGKSPFKELARAFLPVANNNLIDQLDQVSFLEKRFGEILDPNSKQQQKATNPNSTQYDIQETGLGNEAIDVYKLAECWNNGTPEAKLLLVVNYFEQLQGFCHQPQEQKQLFILHDNINSVLDQLTKALQDKDPQYFIDSIAKWSQKNPNTKLLLVIDQFEELITMSQDKRGSGGQSDSLEQNEYKEQEWFLSRLRLTLAKYRQQLHIVLTLRSDFESRFLNLNLKNYWKIARFPVTAMNFNELRDAIEGPALKQALYFEPPELVGELINEVGQMPGGLALLSFTLSELYIKLHERWTKDDATDRALRIKDYEELGGVAGTLTRRANQEYNNLVNEPSGKAYQATMRRVMLRMVAIEGGGVARRRVMESELEYSDPEENKRVKKVIEQLVNVRLLVKGHEDQAQYVEPAHDLLIQGWGLLQEWIRDEQENLLLQNRLAAPTLDWKSANITLQSKIASVIASERKLSVSASDTLREHEAYPVGFAVPQVQDSAISPNHKLLQQNATGYKDSVAKYPDQFLWKQDPRIELLENIAKSEKNWLNELELSFVKACVQYRIQEESKTLEEDIKSNIETSQKLFNANDRLDAIVNMIKTGKRLQKGPKITEYEYLNFLIRFNQLLSECTEINSIDVGEKVNNFSCHQKAQVIATISGYGNKICFWDWQGKLINCEQNQEVFYDLAFSPDGEILVTSGNDGLIKFYRREPKGWYAFHTTQGEPKKHDDKVHCIKFSPDGTFLVSVGFDGNIIFWERGGQYLKTIRLDGHNVDAVAFSPKDQRIAFVSSHKQTSIVVKEYHFPDGQVSQVESSKDIRISDFDEFDAYHEGVITDIDFSPDGTTLVSVGRDGKLRIWPLDKSRNFREIGEDEDGSISAVAFSPDGKILASSHTNGIINIWDALTKNIYGDVPHLYKLVGHKGNSNIKRISFTFNGSQLLSCGDDKIVKFWSLTDRFEGYTTTDVQKVSFSKDNQIVTTVDTDGKLLFWQSTGELLQIQIDNKIAIQSEVCDVQLNNEDTVVAVARNEEIEVKLYSRNGTMQFSFIVRHEQVINNLTFSHKKDIFITTSDNTISLWRLNRDRNTFNVELWTTLAGQDGNITAITFSDDGKFLASGSEDGTVKLWHLEDCQSIFSLPVDGGAVHNDLIEYSVCELTPPQGKIYALRFFHESKIIAAINQWGNIILWSIDENTKRSIKERSIKALEKLALYKHVKAAAFSSNGDQIAMITGKKDFSSCSERRIQTYNLNLDKLIETADSRIQNYIPSKDIS